MSGMEIAMLLTDPSKPTEEKTAALTAEFAIAAAFNDTARAMWLADLRRKGLP